MADIEQLRLLQSKLESPGGADRALDADLAFATGHFDYKLRYGFEDCRILRGDDAERDENCVEVIVRGLDRDKGGLIYREKYPFYTGSTDEALALAERLDLNWRAILIRALRRLDSDGPSILLARAICQEVVEALIRIETGEVEA
jgi:hypothetical protein